MVFTFAILRPCQVLKGLFFASVCVQQNDCAQQTEPLAKHCHG